MAAFWLLLATTLSGILFTVNGAALMNATTSGSGGGTTNSGTTPDSGGGGSASASNPGVGTLNSDITSNSGDGTPNGGVESDSGDGTPNSSTETDLGETPSSNTDPAYPDGNGIWDFLYPNSGYNHDIWYWNVDPYDGLAEQGSGSVIAAS